MNSTTVDIHGAADLLKVHSKTVLDLINTGVLPAARVGRAYVLLTKDVIDHIERQIINQTAERLVGKGRRCRPQKATLNRRSA
ncbi:helix-turn-helix domain-containing protein [Stutzerimonas nitrititolerans]|uniref:helix-turn-helix domain-containing protein n=1 Tax=Stutzerimonas nitrititolerans TaxID=2482751 RepID=UPI0028AEA4F1|nr:helix-turn-helix domain-containing protein [Stutzerimonas nitrititolerans]